MEENIIFCREKGHGQNCGALRVPSAPFLDALPHQFFKASDTPEYRVFWQKSTGEN